MNMISEVGGYVSAADVGSEAVTKADESEAANATENAVCDENGYANYRGRMLELAKESDDVVLNASKVIETDKFTEAISDRAIIAVKSALRAEAQNSRKVIDFYDDHFHSTSQGLVELVQYPRTMTGTPWNSDGYHGDCGGSIPDSGSEGKVVYTMLEKDDGVIVLED